MGGAVGTFEDVIALEPAHESTLRALRALAHQLHAEIFEVARPGDRAVSWGARKMTEAYACALPYRAHVNLGFYRGAHLADPASRLEGVGKAMRHVSLTHRDQVDDQAVRDLMIAAREERRRALGL